MASSSASACALTASSMPLELFSNRVLAAAVPNEELVEDRAETPLFMFLWLLLLEAQGQGQVQVGHGEWCQVVVEEVLYSGGMLCPVSIVMTTRNGPVNHSIVVRVGGVRLVEVGDVIVECCSVLNIVYCALDS